MSSLKTTPPVDSITRAILVQRGHRVLLDSELAALYGASTKRLYEQVKRNLDRFPGDFMSGFTRPEIEALNRSQIGETGSQKHRVPRFPPVDFTEHSAIQAASVLMVSFSSSIPFEKPGGRDLLGLLDPGIAAFWT